MTTEELRMAAQTARILACSLWFGAVSIEGQVNKKTRDMAIAAEDDLRKAINALAAAREETPLAAFGREYAINLGEDNK